jgi:hypothetical protein
VTASQVKAVLQEAESFSPEPPRPLRRKLPNPEPFPAEALGEYLGPAAEGIYERVRAPLAICGQSVLAAATLATQGHADVELPTGQSRPISDYFITIASSGERKTSADSEALWPIGRHEDNLRVCYEAELPGYQNDRDAWAKQREQVLSSKREYPDKQAKRAALDLLGPAPTPPLNPMMVCPEPTFEGLERLFPTGQPSMGVFSGEGGQFVGGHGMRDEGKLRTAAALSAMWDGTPIRRVRAGDGAVMLPGRRLAVHLMLQPDVANILLGDRLLADQGLLSRLLISAPLTAAGTRLWRDPPPEADSAIRRYGGRLLTILETPLPLTTGKANELQPPLMMLSPAARNTWIGFSDHVEKAMRPGGPLDPIRGLANKLPEHAARLAAVLAVVRQIDGREITAEAMDAGIELSQHYAAEALRLADGAAVRPEIMRAERLLKWLLDGWAEEVVSAPDIYQLGPNTIRDKAAAAQAIRVLEDHGWLSRVEDGAVVRGTRRREAWRIWRSPA